MERSSESWSAAEVLSGPESYAMPDLYRLPSRIDYKKTIKILLSGSGICFFFSILFYRSWILGVIALPFTLFFYWKRQIAKIEEERLRRLRAEFKAAAEQMTACLVTGYSIENTLQMVCQQMKQENRADSDLYFLFSAMQKELYMGVNIETVWLHATREIPIEELQDFGEMFFLAKRKGVSLVQIVRQISEQLAMKIQTQMQIETILAGKRAEQKIMNIMPAGILCYICITSPDMMSVMYTTVAGRIVMTIGLAIYIGAFCLAEHILAGSR